MQKLLKYLGILLVLEMIVCLAAVVPAHALTVSLSTTSGAPQTAVTVSGTTNTPVAVTVNFDSLQTWNATPSGSAAPYTWTVSITVPQVPSSNSHSINISGGDGTTSIPFTVTPKVLPLSRLTGSAGNMITVTGYGFATSDSVTINFNGTAAGTGYADATTGSWTSSFAVPAVAAGNYNVDFVSTFGASISSQYFTVISVAAISTSVRSGQVGSSVSLSGSGFLANETVTATFDGTPIGNQATASASGAWTTTFAVPAAPSGSHTIAAYGTTTAISSITGITFTVTPVFTINKTSGSAGTQITVSGTGFASGEQGISVTIDGTAVGSPAQADAVGSWTNNVSIPVLSGGPHAINARGSTTSASSQSLSFNIGAGISLNKSAGTSGTSVTISGSGFGSNENGIAISYDGAPIGTPASANDKGSWTANVTIPPSAGGAHSITASGPVTSSSSISAVSFTIQATISGPNKTSGPVGTSISITGAGFGASETGIVIAYDGVPVGSPVNASASGDLPPINIAVPASAAGSHEIKVAGKTTTATNPPAVNFKVTSGVSFASEKGNIGGTMTLNCTGFAAGSPLKITWDNNPIPNLGTVNTDDSGSFSKSFPVPKSTGGDHIIKVTDSQNNTDNKTFTIDSTPPALPKLSSPADGERLGFTGDVVTTFKWGAVTSLNAPVTYTLQIDSATDFADPWQKENIDANSYTLAKNEALKLGTYYWRVKAIDAASNQSAWSQPRVLQAGVMSITTIILLIVLVLAIAGALIYLFVIRPRALAKRVSAAATIPEIVIPEVVNAEYRALDTEDQAVARKKALPWRLALPQAPPTPKGAKSLSTEDQARLKVIIDFARSLPLIEPGSNTHWLVDMAETQSGGTASPALYSQIIKGEIVPRYEPAWMRHPTFMDLQTLLEGQQILQDLNSFVESVNNTASESVSLIQDIYKDVTAEVNWDVLANGGWAYVSGVYSDSLSWFLGKYLREPTEREYINKPEGQNSEGTSLIGLNGEANTPFAGLLIQAPGDEEIAKLRALHVKLRRVYRNSDRSRTIVGMLTQLDVQRAKLSNAFSQFSRLNT